MELNIEYSDYPFNGTQLCNDLNSNLFFPEDYTDPEVLREAKTICSACPLINECLQYAIKTPWLEGIWGGTTPRQRIRMRSAKNKVKSR
jgi:WhiB family redox-sensing transcriptional regulator